MPKWLFVTCAVICTLVGTYLVSGVRNAVLRMAPFTGGQAAILGIGFLLLSLE